MSSFYHTNLKKDKNPLIIRLFNFPKKMWWYMEEMSYGEDISGINESDFLHVFTCSY